jgi:hypothetical protein
LIRLDEVWDRLAKFTVATMLPQLINRERRLWDGHAREVTTRFRGEQAKNPNRVRVGILCIGGKQEYENAC